MSIVLNPNHPFVKLPRSMGTYTFEAQLFRHGSWGSQDIPGKHTSTMELVQRDGENAYIEWDIPSLGETENIGLILFYDKENGDRLTLQEYDGIMSLPAQAVELLEAAGIHVPEDCK